MDVFKYAYVYCIRIKVYMDVFKYAYVYCIRINLYMNVFSLSVYITDG